MLLHSGSFDVLVSNNRLRPSRGEHVWYLYEMGCCCCVTVAGGAIDTVLLLLLRLRILIPSVNKLLKRKQKKTNKQTDSKTVN